MTKEEAAKKLGIHEHIDYALPQDWVDDFQKRTGLNPVPHFVWCYEYNKHRYMFGFPYPLTNEGKDKLKLYVKPKQPIGLTVKTIDDIETVADRLPDRIKSSLLYRLTNGGEKSEEEGLNCINSAPPEFVLDKWLRYEGIVGYTGEIIEMLDALRAAQKK